MSRKKKGNALPGRRTVRRQSDTAADYERAEAEARVGDHAITPELVAGASARARGVVKVSTQKGPAAAAIIAELLTVLWHETKTLREVQTQGKRLDTTQMRDLVRLADATTKVLREERRQADLDDWSRLSEEEILEVLGPEFRGALSAENETEE